MLAGASYLDIMMSFRNGAPTPYNIFPDTCLCLMNVLELPGLPKSFFELYELSQGFKYSSSRTSPLSRCVTALNGILVHIRKSERYLSPPSYYCRKSYYALSVQAVVDGDYYLRCYSARCVGSTHDALVHAVSSLGKFLDGDELRNEFLIVRDEAYNCTESLLTPIPISQLVGPHGGVFTFFLSSLRIQVEKAFGMLMARWRIL